MPHPIPLHQQLLDDARRDEPGGARHQHRTGRGRHSRSAAVGCAHALIESRDRSPGVSGVVQGLPHDLYIAGRRPPVAERRAKSRDAVERRARQKRPAVGP